VRSGQAISRVRWPGERGWVSLPFLTPSPYCAWYSCPLERAIALSKRVGGAAERVHAF
jgi:hypothetical protein